jgi:orotate phosphoribosyltransferase
MHLFQYGDFTLHSGAKSKWKIECDALTKEDWDGLAQMAYEKIRHLGLGGFGAVEGVPRGGIPFAEAMKKYITTGHKTLLICEDVVTTGSSMKAQLDKCGVTDVLGVAVFARGVVPSWVVPVFQM